MTSLRPDWRIALVALLFAACGSTPANSGPDASAAPVDASPASLCNGAKPTCLEAPAYVLECTEDGGWHARLCEEGTLCYQGACQKMNCVPASKQCKDGGVRTCTSDGQGWSDPVPCATATVCDQGACIAPICTPGAARCNTAGAPERCNGAGTSWDSPGACNTGTACVDGTCLASTCKTGDKQCGPGDVLYTCDASGKWSSAACPTGQSCLFGRCVSCVSSDTCQQWEACADGTCVATTPSITTESITAAITGTPFSFTLTEQGGKKPLVWSVSSTTADQLPDGITLADDGTLTGTPTAPGTKTVKFKLTDALTASDEKALALEVTTPSGPLTITTHSLPDGQMDDVYAGTLAATGGLSPYGWQVIAGALPKGIDLLSNGALGGTPTEYGTFHATFRVLDVATPPDYADAPLAMNIKIAPLKITGSTSIPLLVTHIEAMPTLIQLVPYKTVAAKGGLKPYTWTQKQGPDLSAFGLNKWGLPSGLNYNADGTISGWVTDVSDASTLKIPFTSQTLTGYFDFVQLTDSQSPAATDTAIILLPTVPLVK